MIKKYYNALKGENFLYFLRELEFRYNTRGMSSHMKLEELKDIFDYCKSKCNFAFYQFYELNDFSEGSYSIN